MSASSDFEAYFDSLNKKESKFNFSSLQNPFFNPNFNEIQNLKIQAIFLNKVKINNTWYKEEDKINEAKIKKIKSDRIILEYDGFDIVAKLRTNDKIYID
ncbi:transformation system protein [Campylobacter sp. TTU-622]|uniref:transformation system protein n=1 Tax=unclassified Campylobacter TaxID=2593542 RepID=UPI00190601FE|nr:MULTISPECIES: transformation system protein [unclassified Campylobacter]MBK1971872.1 transformation system protein [Campylobacter sp. TTU_617]MBK1973373.1 transformation system protein [Campylobacter sp. TTU-622]MBK1991413.1 transformation system protein [Campylobacter sp. 2018MI34]